MITRILIITSLFSILALPKPAVAETVRVSTKENAVRKDCKFFAPVVAKVSYGDPMEVLEKEGDWLRVKFEDAEGCIHNSAITEKKIKTIRKESKEGDETELGDATEEEVALAGKGFNPSVEKRYREENPDFNFDAIDSIESHDVPADALAEFIEEGGLKEPQ